MNCAIEIPVLEGGSWPGAKPSYLSRQEMQCRRNPHLANGSTIPQHTGEGSVDSTLCGCLGEGLNRALCLLSSEGDDG